MGESFNKRDSQDKYLGSEKIEEFLRIGLSFRAYDDCLKDLKKLDVASNKGTYLKLKGSFSELKSKADDFGDIDTSSKAKSRIDEIDAILKNANGTNPDTALLKPNKRD
jgi:hypothetical protein